MHCFTFVDIVAFTQSFWCHITTQAFDAFGNVSDTWFFLFFFFVEWRDAQIHQFIHVKLLLSAVLKCRTWISLKYWLLPADGDVVWKMLWATWGFSVLNTVMFTGLRSNAPNLPYPSSSSCTDARLYEMPGTAGAHREKAAVPKSPQ